MKPQRRLPLGLFFVVFQGLCVKSQQTISGTFSGAFHAVVSGSGASPAVPAECPSNAPISCASIGQPAWCCQSGNVCGWNGGSVGCCPQGQSCGAGGWGGGGGGGYWQPTTSYWQPSTSYWQPTSTYWNQQSSYVQQQTVTVYGGGAAGVAGVATATVTSYPQEQAETSVTQAAAGGYCSTIFEQVRSCAILIDDDLDTIANETRFRDLDCPPKCRANVAPF